MNFFLSKFQVPTTCGYKCFFCKTVFFNNCVSIHGHITIKVGRANKFHGDQITVSSNSDTLLTTFRDQSPHDSAMLLTYVN